MSFAIASYPLTKGGGILKIDWSAIRAEFPALAGRAYLNTATFGQLPQRATEAVSRHWQHRDELACADFLDWYDDVDRLRAAIARLIHAAPEDIAFVTNAAAALGIVAAGLEWRPGDNAVTLAGEFPNYLYLPALIERHGVELRADGRIDARTKLVAFSEVNYATGLRAPLAEISQRAKDHGAVLFVDGTQSLGALTFDVRATPVDALAVHGYKWMNSPTGAGFLYVSPQLRERLPPNAAGWRTHNAWREVDNLHHGSPVLKSSAEKYEAGGLPFPLLYAMEASVNMMLEIGPDAIEQRVLTLGASARERLRRLGADVPHNGSQIVAARFPAHDASHLARELRERHVMVAARHGHLRVSPHFYNNESDLDHMEEALRDVLVHR
jgi:selenocysteine lyase/cysteine desulfurase